MKKRSGTATCILIMIVMSLLYNCTKDKGYITPVCDEPEMVSFGADVIPLFEANCSTAGCHSGSAPAGGLDLSAQKAYSQLMQSGSGYVDTVNANFSLIYSQMISSSDPMPPTGKLNSCKTDMILRWIKQKAKNN